MDLLSPLANLVIILTAIGGAIWAALSYLRRPRFIVGMPPTSEEQKAKSIPFEMVGRRSTITQFRYNPACMASPMNEKEALSKKDYSELLSNEKNFRARVLQPDAKGRVKLAVAVENTGGRAAREYILGIQILSSRVHVVDIMTESLDVHDIYATDPSFIENRKIKSKVHSEIIKMYNDFMKIGDPEKKFFGDDQYGDIIFLRGDLEAGMYEMVLFTLAVEPGTEGFELIEHGFKGFVVGYSIDCRDFWLTRQAFFQGFNIPIKNKE